MAMASQVMPAKWQRQALLPHYSLETPAVLKNMVNPAAAKSMPKGMRYWAAKFESAAYGAMVMPITKAERNMASPPLESFCKGMAKPNGGMVTWRRTLSLPGGIKGLEWDQESRLMRARWRAYEYKDTILSASVTWKLKGTTPLALTRFLDSMRIKP